MVLMAEVNTTSDSLQYLHGDLALKILKGRGFVIIPPDTYVTVLLDDFNLACTCPIVYNFGTGTGSPEWNEHLQIPLA